MEENKNPTEPKAEPVKPPSMIQMMKSFGKDLGTWIAQGAPATSPGDYAERLATCEACEHLIKDKMRCGKCGCLVEHKAKWRTTTCPDHRWKPQDARPKTAAEVKLRKQQEEQRKQAQLEQDALQAKRKKLGLDASETVTISEEELETYKKENGYIDYEDV